MASSSKTADPSLLRSKKLESELSHHKKQIQASRSLSIRDKIEKNVRNLPNHNRGFSDTSAAVEAATDNMLLTRLGAPLCVLGGCESVAGMGEKEIVNVQEEMLASGTVVFAVGGGKTAARLVKIPYVERIPSYTTWIFLDRNQRMAEDQSVVGRRRIYYDPYGNETLICSDSDEEIVGGDEMKHVFSDGEDQLLCKALKEHGKNQEVLNILSQFIEVPPSEIEERFELLVEKYQQRHVKDSEASAEVEFGGRQFLNKTLSASLDSFDNLFCRRCLIFDCRLHGCSQTLVVPSEKQSHGFEPEESRKPCSDQCYLKKKYSETLCDNISDATSIRAKEGIISTKNLDNAEASKTQKPSDITDANTTTAEVPSENLGKRKVLKHETVPLRNTKSVVERLDSACKKQKVSLPDSSPVSNLDTNPVSLTNTEAPDSGLPVADQFESKDTRELAICHGKDKDITKDGQITIKMPLVKKSSSSSKGKTTYGWNAIEKDLYLKGVEIFGKNSCLIARNLLSGLKSCMEVSNYMFSSSAALSRTRLSSLHLEDNGNSDHYLMEQDMPPPSRIWRRRGRARKLKYTWKSAGHPFLRKRIGDGKQQACKQYTPCECKLMCGKQCTCMQNGTCCEKYCGCSKSCKNRFRGCHCAKSQCRSRQCPCFAAGRECDPDVCRNCWVSCGDGSLGEPPIRGDGYQCGNMKLLLKQQQRILLGRSDVAGWGAFTKNPVNKNDYLGEYTGELISHKEADKRGKIYDRANSSFLFDLNDQFVLDAYRKGDKLKFANHSSNPNCYAKVMLVAGDHRVGIFAKEHIGASEELFYDYRYGPDQAPAWARKPGGSKRDDSSASHSRAQKIA